MATPAASAKCQASTHLCRMSRMSLVGCCCSSSRWSWEEASSLHLTHSCTSQGLVPAQKQKHCFRVPVRTITSQCVVQQSSSPTSPATGSRRAGS